MGRNGRPDFRRWMAAPAAGLLLGGALAGLVHQGLRDAGDPVPLAASDSRPVAVPAADTGAHPRWADLAHPSLAPAAATGAAPAAPPARVPPLVQAVLSSPVWSPPVFASAL
ncbi:MAG: hypothetical protein ACXVXR_19625, partial [Blastococcus sp.]